jgi:hypothetical protein
LHAVICWTVSNPSAETWRRCHRSKRSKEADGKGMHCRRSVRRSGAPMVMLRQQSRRWRWRRASWRPPRALVTPSSPPPPRWASCHAPSLDCSLHPHAPRQTRLCTHHTQP